MKARGVQMGMGLLWAQSLYGDKQQGSVNKSPETKRRISERQLLSVCVLCKLFFSWHPSILKW
jgi:hypothetical protein